MSSYYGYARSNYFRVRNVGKFKAAVKNCDVRVEPGRDKDKGKVALLSTGESGWSSSYWDDRKQDDIEFEITDIVAAHLKPGEVAIFVSVGWENMQYLAGYAVAVNSKKERVQVSLDDIYRHPRVLALGSNITRAEH
ncbi:MAG: hypothetical protein WAX69_22270 [Victivallales bacterium]